MLQPDRGAPDRCPGDGNDDRGDGGDSDTCSGTVSGHMHTCWLEPCVIEIDHGSIIRDVLLPAFFSAPSECARAAFLFVTGDEVER
ncbi:MULTISPECIES: hypothetical protein [unclassified Streptomyces]|uniref:hypothetical protein n=1 Tax=unclassified Streptomyces TaxID=2593676 RepID=UPI002E29252D|nr:hypothetical protein [Streptomyces sp. NBC_00273]